MRSPNLRSRCATAAAVAVLFLGSIGSMVAQTATPVATPAHPDGLARSPFSLVGTRAGRLYATGPTAARRTLLAPNTGPAPSGPASGVRRAPAPGADRSRPLAAPSPVLASQTTAPDNHVAGFAGLTAGNQADTSAEPANSTVAVGPDQVVQIANTEMRITNRNGTAALNITVSDFFGLRAGFFDRQPRIIYDSLHGRFVATELSWDCTPDASATFGHGYIVLAVSTTTDPNGAWDLYAWVYDNLVPVDPSLGTSTDKLAMTSNLSSMTHGDGGQGDGSCADSALTFDGGDILIANWADAIAHKASTLLATEYLAGAPVAHVRAALQTPATSTTLYVVARASAADPMSGALPDDVIVTTFTGTTTKSVVVAVGASWDMTQDGLVAPFADPPAPHQPGSPATIVNAVDGNPQDALWQAGRLTWAITYPCTPNLDSGQRDCVRVTQLDTSLATQVTPPTETQDFLLARKSFDSYEPGIGISGDGTLDVVYSQSNSAAPNYPSSYQQYQGPTDINALSAPVQLVAGTGTYPGTEWGTYVGLAQDPQIATAVWQANAYSVGTGYWSTFVDQLGQTTGTTYFPIGPLRIVDSRNGSGASHLIGKFVSSTARTFRVSGLTPIPSNAVAVTGNVTVTRQTAAGYVVVTPTAQNSPSSSTVNFPLGDNRANNVTVPLSRAGTLAMTYVASAGKTTDLVFDVTGYFLPDDSGATYHPATPTRLLDSRSGTGQPGGTPAKFLTGVPQTFTIGDGLTVPVAASAITGNLTVTGQTKAGYLAITPDRTSAPPISNLNFPTGDNRANGFTAPLNVDHQFSIVYVSAAGARTDVVLDLTGYYVADLTGQHFYPLNPGRIMDTRAGVANSGKTGVFVSSVPRDLAASGHWGIPTDAQALTGNLTVTGQTAAGAIAITPTSDANPTTSTLNFPTGDNRANGVTVPIGLSGSLWLVLGSHAGKTANLILDVTGYFR